MNTTRSNKSKKDITHAVQLKLHERTNKKQFELVVTSNGRNKNLEKHSLE